MIKYVESGELVERSAGSKPPLVLRNPVDAAREISKGNVFLSLAFRLIHSAQKSRLRESEARLLMTRFEPGTAPHARFRREAARWEIKARLYERWSELLRALA